MRLAAGRNPGWSLPAPVAAGPTGTPDGDSWVEPVRSLDGFWLEAGGSDGTTLPTLARRAATLLGAVLEAERHRALLAEELAGRYEEIDLLYAISEILGQTVRLDEAAQTIVREVATVVGARRASIMVHDETADVLRTVASSGFSHVPLEAVPVGDPNSVAARVFRERRPFAHEPVAGATPSLRGAYRGEAFLSVPIVYATPGGRSR